MKKILKVLSSACLMAGCVTGCAQLSVAASYSAVQVLLLFIYLNSIPACSSADDERKSPPITRLQSKYRHARSCLNLMPAAFSFRHRVWWTSESSLIGAKLNYAARSKSLKVDRVRCRLRDHTNAAALRISHPSSVSCRAADARSLV